MNQSTIDLPDHRAQVPPVAARFDRLKARPVALEVRGLEKCFPSPHGEVVALQNIDFAVHRREFMGHVVCSIPADSCGWHDPLAGHSNAALVRTKYGPSTYQNERNNFYRNARDQFLIELSKWGLGKMDLVANINFFSKVTVDAEGKIRFVAENSNAGSYVDLRAEMDALLVLNTCQHAMDPDPHYNPRSVHIAVWKSHPPADDDLCRTARPENSRGFALTEALYLA